MAGGGVDKLLRNFRKGQTRAEADGPHSRRRQGARIDGKVAGRVLEGQSQGQDDGALSGELAGIAQLAGLDGGELTRAFENRAQV